MPCYETTLRANSDLMIGSAGEKRGRRLVVKGAEHGGACRWPPPRSIWVTAGLFITLHVPLSTPSAR